MQNGATPVVIANELKDDFTDQVPTGHEHNLEWITQKPGPKTVEGPSKINYVYCQN